MCETSDSLERSSSSSSATLYFSEAERPGGLQSRGVSLGAGPYAFEHGVAMPDTPSPQVAGGRRARRRRVRAPSLVVTRGSKLRRVSEARPTGRQEEEENGNAPSSPARDNSFLNLWPCQSSSSSSSSSCSSSTSSALFSTSAGEGEAAAADKPVGWPSGRRSDAAGSLSFLTAKERAWLGPEATAMEQSAPPPSRGTAGGDGEDEEARARGAQVEEDAALARRLQEQFDGERRRQRCHHNQRGCQQNDTEPLDRELQQREARSPRSGQHSQNNHHGIGSSHSSTEQLDNHALDLLPDSDCPWLAAVQWAAFSSMMNSHGGTDLPIRQPRGRGRGGGLRYAQLSDTFGGNQYEGLLDFGLRQVATKKKLNKREISVFPTKTYDPAQSAGNTRCQICFCDYACGEELRMLTCFHDYHVKCIDRWLKVNATCPVCRCNMAERQVPERSGMSPTPRSPTLTD